MCLGVSLISWNRVDGVGGGGFDPLRLYFPLRWVMQSLLVAADLRARELYVDVFDFRVVELFIFGLFIDGGGMYLCG